MLHWTPRIRVHPLIAQAPGSPPAPLRLGFDAVSWMFDPENPIGFVRFYRDHTSGFIDISADVRPVVLVEDAAFVAAIDSGVRDRQLQTCVTIAMQSLSLNPSDYDGVVFFLLNAAVNSGSQGLRFPRMRMGAVLDGLRPHDHHAHEIGHVIGLDHAFGRTGISTYPDGEYQQAACIMGASGASVFPLSVDPQSDIDPAAVFWTAAGPGVSMAAAWRWSPSFERPGSSGAAAPPPFVNLLPRDTERQTVTLRRPGLGGVTLAAIPDASGTDFLTVEYRPSTGWDTGFGGPDAEPCVVIQRITDIPALPHLGGGYVNVKPARVMLERLITRAETDRDWTDGDLTVRVDRMDPDRAVVVIGRGVSTGPAVRLAARRDERVETSRRPSELRESYLGGRDCQLRTVVLEEIAYRCSARLEFDTVGLDTPVLSFRIGGRAVAPGVTASLRVRAERSERELSVAPWVALEVVPTSSGLTITSPGGIGTYSISVEVVATGRSGGTAELSIGVGFSDLEIARPAGAREDAESCAESMRELGEHRIPRRILQPGEDVTGYTRWNRLTLQEKAAALGLINPFDDGSVSGAKDLARGAPARIHSAAVARRRFGPS